MNTTSTNSEQTKIVYVVDDDIYIQRLVCRLLKREGYEPTPITTGEECLDKLTETLPVAILLDLNLPRINGIATLRKIKAKHQQLPVIMMTAEVGVDTVVTCIQAGANGYLAKPFDRVKLIKTLNESIKKSDVLVNLESLTSTKKRTHYEKLIGQSAPMQHLFNQLDSIANSNITVLIQGASGTGKELVAQAIHATSARKNQRFVALNCAAIPENLHESELFGHEKGSFTGATSRKIGKFELADGGTLFLDEVGEMSLSLQSKLLRVLQERNFQRVGGSNDISIDVRLITASHVNLASAVKAGKFRDDLYYRLAVFELQIPALVERKEDIKFISQKLVEDFSIKAGKKITISEDALSVLQEYDFPGNVRELQNALHRASVVCQNNIITVQDLPERIIEAGNSDKLLPKTELRKTEPSLSSNLSLDYSEKQAIENAINNSNGNISAAIRKLKIGRATLYRKLKKYNISVTKSN